MKHNVFAVYDTKANAYLTPFFLPTVGMAVRVFSDCVNSDSHQFGAHPEDYTLFHLGTWDDSTSKFDKLDHKRALHNGVELKNPVNSDNLDLFEEEEEVPLLQNQAS